RLPLRALVEGGPGRRIPHARAPARAGARRDPPGSLCAETADTAAAGPPARPARHREDARGAGRRRRPRVTRPELARLRDDRCRDSDVPCGEAVRLEEDDVLVALAPGNRSADDLLQLVHLEPIEHP